MTDHPKIEAVETDPVLDMTIMQNRIDELQKQVDEQEYFIAALQDSHRIALMNHLMPYYLKTCRNEPSMEKVAFGKARKTAGLVVDTMAEEMNAKAAAYRNKIEEQREQRKKDNIVIEFDDNDGDGEVEN